MAEKLNQILKIYQNITKTWKKIQVFQKKLSKKQQLQKTTSRLL